MSPSARDSGDDVLRSGGLPDSDPLRFILATIVELVPVSKWSFAQFFGERRAHTGPSIATARLSDDYPSGLSLLFADKKAQFGTLTLLRSPRLGPFTSSEIRTLTFALDAASDQLSELRLTESTGQEPIGFELGEIGSGGRAEKLDPPDSSQYILNREFEIVLAWTAENERRIAITPLRARLQNRLPRLLEDAVRDLTAGWTSDAKTQKPGAILTVPFLVVRTRPMSGPAGLFIGVTIERSKPASALAVAAARYSISPREVQVLALLLDGGHLDQIAQRLHISASTVQDHIKKLLEKTGTRNRSAMIAKVFGWSQTAKRATD